MVQVTYTNIQTPVLTLDDAIQKGAEIPLPVPPIDVGDATRKYNSLNQKRTFWFRQYFASVSDIR